MSATRSRYVAWCTLLIGVSGCFRLPDDYIDEDLYLALDYRLDRPRLVGLKSNPPFVVAGRTSQIDALFLGPSDIENVRADICGLREDVAVSATNVMCFREEDLVEPIGEGLPFQWDVPALEKLARTSCGPDGEDSDPYRPCTTAVPLRLEGLFADGESAFGGTEIPIMLLPDGAPLPDRQGLDATKIGVSWSGDASPGGEVQITADVQLTPGWFAWYDFRWFVDAGDLVETGRTSADDLWIDHVESKNTLRIPDDYEGPLRVAVVVRGVGSTDSALVGDMGWTVLSLDIVD